MAGAVERLAQPPRFLVAARRMVLAAAAVLATAGSPAYALDPATALTEFSLRNWSESAGPFPFGVYAIAQDRDGYLWLGTRTGLIRFDGTTFTIWKGAEPLPEDRVSVLHAARDGSLWLGFGTVGGVARIRQGSVTNFGERDGVPAGAVNALVEGDDGSMWVGTFSGVARFAGDRWERVGQAAGLPEEQVLSVHRDRSGTLRVATASGVYARRSGESTFSRTSPRAVTDLVEGPPGRIWIADPRTGFRPLAAAADDSWQPPAPDDTYGRALLYDRAGSLWVGTRSSGVLRVRGAGTRTAVVESLTRREGLESDEIRTLFEDRDGTLWIGTRMGLTRLSESSVRAVGSGTGEDPYVYAVTRTPDGSVWTATAAGVWRRNRDGERNFGAASGLPGQTVTALHVDENGTLWAATTRGIARFASGRFASINLPADIRFESIRSITTDRSGALWICDSLKGLFRWSEGNLTRVDEGLHPGDPYVAYTDRRGAVWVGFWSGGLTVYDGGRIARYSVAEGLPTATVNVIYEDAAGATWVGTAKSLARFDNGRFVTYSQQGFPQTTVVSIAEDDRGHLWFGLGSGLLQIERSEFGRAAASPQAHLRYKIYGNEDGLPGTLGRPGMPSATRGGDGRLWFITSVGVAVVDPDRLRERPAPGPLRVEGVTADGRFIVPVPSLELPPRTSRIEIDYSILNLAAVPRVRSRYRLEGFESAWQEAGERRQATYTNLPPGSYRFHAVSTNADGGWNSEGAVFEFSIEPAFYQTGQFYAAAAIVLGSSVWWIWRLRLRRVKRQFDLVLAERARVAREIHDTLLQSLVGVALEFDDISSQLDPSSGPLKTQVGRIRERVERYIREARQSIWDLRSPTLESADLLTALRDFGSAATGGSDVVFEFDVAGKPRRLGPKVEEQLLRIGQEAITNALRHGEPAVIRMELSYAPDSVLLRVSDDGRGFDPEKVVQAREVHWGVAGMQERAQQIGARFHLWSKPGAGTTVEAVASLSSTV
jgi:signal transduction histidine kinase/ligand-binding sensor domain-containing protein